MKNKSASKNIFKIAFLFLAVVFLLPKISQAATINVASCSYQDVKNAVASAGAGDTVNVPAGNCTWTSQLTVSKGITIKGAGIDLTTIVANVATKAGDSGKLALVMDVSGTTPWHLSDLTFTDTGTYYDYEGVFKINGTSNGWRMNNVKFINTNARGMVIGGNSTSAPYTTYGVIDHCQFINTGGQAILIRPYSSTAANALWLQPTNLGAADAVFIEDSVFSNTAGEGHTAFDSEWGAKVVFRHNTLTNSFVLDHGYENNRSAIKLEIYGNTFNATIQNQQPAITFRGGTGVAFNNTITAISYGYDYDLLVRDYCSISTTNCFGGVQCTSYPCHDQVGRTSGPAYPNQTLQPLYVWNNIYNGSAFVVDINASNNVIQKNRDYYEGGVTYNSGTDTYTHGATGFTYKPYAYPHPLTQIGTPTPYCGDQSCNNNETCSTCPDDCGVCPPTCGDSSCNNNETCSTCPDDCGVCPPTCGDSSCNNNETCSTCPADCGECPPTPVTYGINDFKNVVSNWLKTGAGLQGDVNNDSKVNTQDLGIMMSKWAN